MNAPDFGNPFLGELNVGGATLPTELPTFKIEFSSNERLVLKPAAMTFWILLALGIPLLSGFFFFTKLGVVGMLFIRLALSQIGLVYAFDGPSRTFHRRRLLGGTTTWEPGSVYEISFIAWPEGAEYKGIQINLHHSKSKSIICLYSSEPTPDREHNLLQAIQGACFISKLLQVPARVYGDIDNLPPALKRVLTPVTNHTPTFLTQLAL